MVEHLEQYPYEIPVPVARHSPEPPWAVGAWIAWLLGPGSLLGLVLLTWATSRGEPMPAEGFAVFGIVPLQAASMVLTAGMLISRGKFRRVPEFWLLVAYWIPVVTLFRELLSMRSDRMPTAEFINFWRLAILCTAISFPLLGGLRLLVGKSRAMTPPKAI